MKDFCSSFNFKTLIRVPTCYKNPDKPSCIDLILTNSPRSFQSSCAIETGLSDFHKMTVTVMKASFQKLKPRVINYRKYSSFSSEKYREDLVRELSEVNFKDNSISQFLETCVNVLNKHAPRKKKFLRGNHSPFMNRELSKAIMTRTRFRNKFLKNRSDANRAIYIKQRNYCVSLLRKTKREYYSNLNEKDVIDNKKFWKTVKPFLSDKSVKSSKITLIAEDGIITDDKKIAETFNTFYTNIVTNLKIPEYKDQEFIDNCIADPISTILAKYKNHPSIIRIKTAYKSSCEFNFKQVERVEILNEIKSLRTSKASQDSDIPTKIIKENADFFADFLHTSYNECIKSGIFPSCLKWADVTPIFKKGIKSQKDNYRPVSILPNISKCLKSLYLTRCLHSSIKYSRYINVDFERVLMPNIVS